MEGERMKRTKKGILIVGILALAAGLVVVLSQKGKEDGTDAYDFWKETYEAVARKTKGASRYEEIGRASCRERV